MCASPNDDENPIAPAASDSWSSRTIAAICSSVAGAWVASSPMTTRRMVEWPTWKPAFTARRPSMRDSHSPKVRQSHAGPASSDARGMPSTLAIICIT